MEEKKENYLYRFTPVGGVAEIGSNIFLIENQDEALLIDAGAMFPPDEWQGINYLVPNLTKLPQAKVKTLIITHGHEDHIGALLHILDHFPGIQVYTSEFTRNLILKKFPQCKSYLNHFHLYDTKTTLEVLNFTLHFLFVDHSIPETFGLLFLDKIHSIATLFISDFKLDLNRVREEIPLLSNCKKILPAFEKKIFFIDSTNSHVEGNTLSENDLIPSFENLIANQKKHKLIFTFFSTNVERFLNLCHLAKKYNKKIFLHGRSMEEMGNLIALDPINQHLLTHISSDEKLIKDFGLHNSLIFLSGPQGDFRGAFKRVMTGESNLIKLEENDQVVFSSNIIPGNEKRIFKIFNKIMEAKATLIRSKKGFPLHASGHPSEGDLTTLYNELEPTDVIPIHGESYLLDQHLKLIKKQFSKITPHLIYNFDTFSISPNKELSIEKIYEKLEEEAFNSKRTLFDKTCLNQRRKMGLKGLAAFTIIHRNQLEIDFSFVGLPSFLSLTPVKEEFEKAIGKLFDKRKEYTNETQFEMELRSKLNQIFLRFLDEKPVCVLHIKN